MSLDPDSRDGFPHWVPGSRRRRICISHGQRVAAVFNAATDRYFRFGSFAAA